MICFTKSRRKFIHIIFFPVLQLWIRSEYYWGKNNVKLRNGEILICAHMHIACSLFAASSTVPFAPLLLLPCLEEPFERLEPFEPPERLDEALLRLLLFFSRRDRPDLARSFGGVTSTMPGPGSIWTRVELTLWSWLFLIKLRKPSVTAHFNPCSYGRGWVWRDQDGLRRLRLGEYGGQLCAIVIIIPLWFSSLCHCNSCGRMMVHHWVRRWCVMLAWQWHQLGRWWRSAYWNLHFLVKVKSWLIV